MTGVKISNLPPIVTPALADVFPVSQDGVTYKETITQLATLLTQSAATASGVQDQAYSFVVDSGAVNAYIGAITPVVAAYVTGQRFDLLIGNTNTGASTIDFGAGIENIALPDGTALIGGEMIAGQISSFEFNGTNFQLMNRSRGLLGTTTNNNAPVGYVGEFVSSNVLVGSAVVLTSAVAANITSISLSAGDWDVWANMVTAPAAGTTTQQVGCAINTTSATFPTMGIGNPVYNVNNIPANANQSLTAPVVPARLSLSGITTVYMVGLVTFSVSTMSAYGFISARRRR